MSQTHDLIKLISERPFDTMLKSELVSMAGF